MPPGVVWGSFWGSFTAIDASGCRLMLQRPIVSGLRLAHERTGR